MYASGMSFIPHWFSLYLIHQVCTLSSYSNPFLLFQIDKTVTNPSMASPTIQTLPRKRPPQSHVSSPPKAKRSKTLKKGGVPGMSYKHHSVSTPLFLKNLLTLTPGSYSSVPQRTWGSLSQGLRKTGGWSFWLPLASGKNTYSFFLITYEFSILI